MVSQYSNFLQQLDINDDSFNLEANPELLKEVKQYVKKFNDHVRFYDSPDVSAAQRKKRDRAAAFDSGVAAPQAMGVQQYQGTTGEGANAGGGPHTVTTTGVNGTASVAGGVVDAALSQRLSRPTQLPAHFRDGHTVLLGANAGNRMRSEAAAAVRATSFKLENLYNPECTDISTRFPSFRDILPTIENQFELVAQLSSILYDELESATSELKKVEEMMRHFNITAPLTLKATNKLTMDLLTYTTLMKASISVGDAIQAAALAAPNAIALNATSAAAAADINPVEGVQEELQPVAAPPPPTATYSVHQLEGYGYFGHTVVITRVDVRGSGILGDDMGAGRKRRSSTVPPGKYFLLSELFTLFGDDVKIDSEEPYSTWKKWVSRL